MRIFSVCLIFFLLIFPIFPKVLIAQEATEVAHVTQGQINEALIKTVPLRFLPDHPLYYLITVKESISRFFQPSAARRADFDFILSGKRLKESYLLSSINQKGVSNNLRRYSIRLLKMIEQFKKAKSQNQQLEKVTDDISAGLVDHDILLLAIGSKEIENDFNYIKALESFEKAVFEIEKYNPGVKGRFRIIRDREAEKLKEFSMSVELDSSLLEATPSVNPRRIIF